MNILRVFTRKSLLANRSRTLVTIIGIILSMALFTAVIEGAYSGQQFLLRSVEEVQGRWLIYESGLSYEQAELLSAAEGVKETALWQEVGWGEVGSKREYKPYLLVEACSADIENLLSIRLLSGRMPENADELLVPSHLADNGGVFYHEGDTLTIALGRRTDKAGNELNASHPMENGIPEQIVDAALHTYTVVGIYERFEPEVESFGCPGYTALTVSGQGNGNFTLFYTLKHPGRTVQWLEAHPALGDRTVHSDLRRFHGSFATDSYNTLLYGFAGVLVFLISFGSISLIYNSFSISVSERTRQFGILKSVGATKRQIRASVRYEALLLSAVGIPTGLILGCAGIGITLYCLRSAFTGLIFTGATTQMRLVLHPAALGAAVAVCLATTLISAAIPARRAIRISPIDSIRQTADVKLKGREVRTGRLTQKLFGFEGTMAAKNFKRNRRRCRSTVVSLFLSVVLFISASSFCAYLTDTVNSVSGREDSPDITYYTVGENKPDPDAVNALLTSAAHVSEGMYYDAVRYELAVPTDMMDRSWNSLAARAGEDIADTESFVAQFVFVDDAAFRRLCEENGIDPSPYFDTAHPAGLVQNEITGWVRTEDGKARQYEFRFFDESRFPRTAPVYAEDVQLAEVTIGAALKTGCMGITENVLALYYPYSLRKAVFPDSKPIFETDFAFRTENHAHAYEEMKKLLSDAGMDVTRLNDHAADKESVHMMVVVINVFAYGFIILISLIAVANVFNTISTNVLLRRREFAMLRSIGLGQRGFRRMMNYECVIYGVRGLAWGIPAAIGITWVIWRITANTIARSFYIPWYSVAISVGSVFAVAFATMIYASARLRKDNPVEALKNENL